MTVAESSITAFWAHTASGRAASQHAAILAAMAPGHRYSRRMLAGMAGIETSAAAGRCNELVEQGRIVPAGQMSCPITQKTVEALALPGTILADAGTSFPAETTDKPGPVIGKKPRRCPDHPNHSQVQCLRCCVDLVLNARSVSKDRARAELDAIERLGERFGLDVPDRAAIVAACKAVR